jgi:Fic family protein
MNWISCRRILVDVAVRYVTPRNWIVYEFASIQADLLEAKAAVLALRQIPYQRSWADQLQRVQLKREVAGTSRIEGAEFTERELEAAMRDTPEQLETRSQKQAAAAVATYQWIAQRPDDRPVDVSLISDVHRRLVTGCDDDHCPPGQTRKRDENVTFGAPRHRGVDGGDDTDAAMTALVAAVRTVYQEHDPLIRALALHYHVAAMHPFLDGNGRTARALEALMLQRTGLRDTLFIAMSNYYYENKTGYLNALADTRAADHDLTAFLKFALKGVESQCRSLFAEIRRHVAKALYRNTMTDLFGRLRSPRKRVMSARHIQLANLVLAVDEISLAEMVEKSRYLYTVKNPDKALARDLNYLSELGAIFGERRSDEIVLWANLDWPTQITETEFFRLVKELPKGRLHAFLSR